MSHHWREQEMEMERLEDHGNAMYDKGYNTALSDAANALSEAMRPWWGLAPYQAVSETIYNLQNPTKETP